MPNQAREALEINPVEKTPQPVRKVIGTASVLVIILVGLYLISRQSYVLFHTVVELFIIVATSAIFTIAWNARAFIRNNYYYVLSVAFAGTAVILILHMIAYKGMGVFPWGGNNLPTQMWLASRYVLVVGFLAAPLAARRKPAPIATIVVFLALTVALITLIFTGNFPAAYVEGVGLTAFKIISEYVIAGLLIVSIFVLRTLRKNVDKEVYVLTTTAILTLVASELFFTVYTDPYSLSNMMGHFLQIIGFFLIYTALIRRVLTEPYSVIVRELKQHEMTLQHLAITDRLTGLFNYGFFQEQLEREMGRAARYGSPLALLMIDIDDFKFLNDSCGHMAGDKALVSIASIIKNALRRIDLPARYGGEEFVVILPETDGETAEQVADRLRGNIEEYEFFEDNDFSPVNLTVSIGVAEYPLCGETPRALVQAADTAMYKSKSDGKNRTTLYSAYSLLFERRGNGRE